MDAHIGAFGLLALKFRFVTNFSTSSTVLIVDAHIGAFGLFTLVVLADLVAVSTLAVLATEGRARPATALAFNAVLVARFALKNDMHIYEEE